MVNQVSSCDPEVLSNAWNTIKECTTEGKSVLTDLLKDTLCTIKDKVVYPTAQVIDSVFRKHIGWLAFVGGSALIFKGVSNLTHLTVEKIAQKRRELQTKAIVELGLGVIGVAAGTILIV